MKTNHQCPACKTLLPSDAPEGLCPRCLLEEGLNPARSTETQGQTLLTQIECPTLNPDPVGSPGPRSESIRYFGDYEIIQEVARGGMGIVFKARQTTLNRVVAVKMILAGELASDVAVRRFHKEAEAAATLQHPNIVAIHEVGEHGGCHYFSMDLVNGEDLSRKLQRGPMDPREAATCMKKVASAIAYAHRHGTLHRDLKPSNILIDEEGEPRVTDFGLAKRQTEGESLTLSGAILGTPAYMAPEQAEGRAEEIDRRTDVFALGAVLYALLTGRAPFAGDTPLAIMRNVVETEPQPPSALNKSVPRDLERVCLKCLEKNPVNRYQTATELGEDLDRFLNNEPVKAGARSRAFDWMVWLQKNQWLPTGILSIGLMTLLVLLYTWIQRSKYLIWKAAHPGQMTERTPFMGFIGLQGDANGIAIMLLFLSLLFIPPVLLGAFGYFKIRSRLSPGKLNLFLCSALFNMALCMAAIFRGAYCIVWNEENPEQVLGFSFVLVPSAVFGMYLLWLIAREWRSQRFGEKKEEIRATFGELPASAPAKRGPMRRETLNLLLSALLSVSLFHHMSSWMVAIILGIQAVWGAVSYMLIRKPSRLTKIFQLPRLNRLLLAYVMILPGFYFVIIPIGFPTFIKNTAWPGPYGLLLFCTLIGAGFARLYELMPERGPEKPPDNSIPSFRMEEQPYFAQAIYVASLGALMACNFPFFFPTFIAFNFGISAPSWILSRFTLKSEKRTGPLLTALLMAALVILTNLSTPMRTCAATMVYGLVTGVVITAVRLYPGFRNWRQRYELAGIWALIALAGVTGTILCRQELVEVLTTKQGVKRAGELETVIMMDPTVFMGTAELEGIRRGYSAIRAQEHGLKVLEKMSTLGSHKPFQTFHLTWMAARLEQEIGRTSQAAEKLSFLTDGFKLVSATNFSAGPLLTEAEARTINLPSPQNPLGTLPVPWKEIGSHEGQLAGYVDLSSHFRGQSVALDQKSCFVRLLVTSPTECKARLGFGFNGGINAWWNGEMLSRKMFHNNLALDNNVAVVDMLRGTNVFIARIRKSSEDWGMLLRITATNQTGIPGLQFIKNGP